MEHVWLTIIALALSLVSTVGGVITRDRQLTAKIADGDKELHGRITKIQSEYVRQDTLGRHTQGIENSLYQMREEQRETNRRIDHVLAVLSKKEYHP